MLLPRAHKACSPLPIWHHHCLDLRLPQSCPRCSGPIFKFRVPGRQSRGPQLLALFYFEGARTLYNVTFYTAAPDPALLVSLVNLDVNVYSLFAIIEYLQAQCSTTTNLGAHAGIHDLGYSWEHSPTAAGLEGPAKRILLATLPQRHSKRTCVGAERPISKASK
eukprot:scaffold9203_cov24-Tisochrysis_lutea.AAC.4